MRLSAYVIWEILFKIQIMLQFHLQLTPLMTSKANREFRSHLYSVAEAQTGAFIQRRLFEGHFRNLSSKVIIMRLKHPNSLSN